MDANISTWSRDNMVITRQPLWNAVSLDVSVLVKELQKEHRLTQEDIEEILKVLYTGARKELFFTKLPEGNLVKAELQPELDELLFNLNCNSLEYELSEELYGKYHWLVDNHCNQLIDCIPQGVSQDLLHYRLLGNILFISYLLV